MNDRFPYDFDDLQGKSTYHGNYLNSMDPEATTNKKIDTLDNLPLNKTAKVISLNCTRFY